MGEFSVQQVLPRRHHESQERGPQQSLECGVDFSTQDENWNQMMPIYLQPNVGPFQIATLLLHHGANLNTRDIGGESSSYQGIEGEYYFQGHCLSIRSA
jgi:hypothetical protein